MRIILLVGKKAEDYVRREAELKSLANHAQRVADRTLRLAEEIGRMTKTDIIQKKET